MKTETDLDVIVRELVEWKDGWEWCEDGSYYQPSFLNNGNFENRISRLKGDLNLVRELEVAVIEAGHSRKYGATLSGLLDLPYSVGISITDQYKLAMADPEPRLRALHRTLREAGEI